MPEVSETFMKVQTEDCSRLFRIKVVWTESNFKLTVIEKMDAWAAQVTMEEVIKQANILEINLQDYYKNLKDYIFNKPKGISFNIVENNLYIYRTISKMKITYFSTPLNKIDYVQCIESILDELNDKNLNLTNKLKTAETERLDANMNKESYENKLKEFVDMKEKHDMQLMSNFLLLLNEKKKRIQHLTDMLEVYKTNSGKLPKPLPAVKLPTKKKKTKKKIASDTDSDNNIKTSPQEVKHLETLSASESETYNTETDDEQSDKMEVQTGDYKRGVLETEPVPSTSKECFNFLLEDDLHSPVTIAKRIKMTDSNVTNSSGSNVTNNVYGGTEKTAKDTGNRSINKVGYKKEEMDVEENSPVLDFDTQDLLDRM